MEWIFPSLLHPEQIQSDMLSCLSSRLLMIIGILKEPTIVINERYSSVISLNNWSRLCNCCGLSNLGVQRESKSHLLACQLTCDITVVPSSRATIFLKGRQRQTDYYRKSIFRQRAWRSRNEKSRGSLRRIFATKNETQVWDLMKNQVWDLMLNLGPGFLAQLGW